MPLELPSSLASLLSLFRTCFTRPTFETFCALSIGLLTRVRARTVTGMLVASGCAASWHHTRAHRFFSRARWSVDQVGLVVLELIVRRLAEERAPLCLAIDDTLVKRFGPKVFGRCRNFDGSSQAAAPRQSRIAWGNSWVVAGIVVELPFLERPICLPVLFRLWRPGQGPTQVELACELVQVIARRYPARRVEVVADGAYAGQALAPAKLPPNVCLVLRTRRDIRLDRPAPTARPGQTGRPRLKGKRLPSLRTRAAGGACWRPLEAERCGQRETVEIVCQRGLWWRVWRDAPVKLVALRDPGAADQIDAVLITSDPDMSPRRIVELYAKRWAIEVAFRDAKQFAGVGEVENRTRLAVERSAPFAFLCLTLAIAWYALDGHAPGDVSERRRRSPWYRTKHQPSVEDMLVKLRRTLIAARLSVATDERSRTSKVAHFAQTLEMAAA